MNSNEIIPGLVTGITSALLFNPIDKIIFTSCILGKSFFSKEIYSNLFKGSLNNIGTRIITSGLYFAYIDHYASITDNKLNVAIMTSIICSITNPIQLVKFNGWYNNTSSRNTINTIYKTYGIRGFGIGITPLIMRDIIFNYIYISYKDKNNHINNIGIICTALSLSAPLNLIKNKKYSTNESLKSILTNFKFKQLGIGMIIIRSCLSFYSGQLIYDYSKKYLNNTY